MKFVAALLLLSTLTCVWADSNVTTIIPSATAFNTYTARVPAIAPICTTWQDINWEYQVLRVDVSTLPINGALNVSVDMNVALNTSWSGYGYAYVVVTNGSDYVTWGQMPTQGLKIDAQKKNFGWISTIETVWTSHRYISIIVGTSQFGCIQTADATVIITLGNANEPTSYPTTLPTVMPTMSPTPSTQTPMLVPIPSYTASGTRSDLICTPWHNTSSEFELMRVAIPISSNTHLTSMNVSLVLKATLSSSWASGYAYFVVMNPDSMKWGQMPTQGAPFNAQGLIFQWGGVVQGISFSEGDYISVIVGTRQSGCIATVDVMVNMNLSTETEPTSLLSTETKPTSLPSKEKLSIGLGAGLGLLLLIIVAIVAYHCGVRRTTYVNAKQLNQTDSYHALNTTPANTITVV